MASVKIKLKVHATHHYHCKRSVPAHWRAIANVRYLFGLALHIKVTVQYIKLAVQYIKLTVQYIKLAVQYIKLTVQYIKLAVQYIKLAVQYIKLAVHQTNKQTKTPFDVPLSV